MQGIHTFADQRVTQIRAMGERVKLGPVLTFGPIKAGHCGLRDRCAAALGKTAGATPVGHGQNAGGNRRFDPGRSAGIAEPQEAVRFKEELCQRLCCACVHLGFEPVDILRHRGRIGMTIGIGADADVEFAHIGQRCDQFDRVGVAIGMCFKCAAICRIAAQGHNVAHAGCRETLGGFADLRFALARARQMGGHGQAGGLAQRLRRLLRQRLC
mmetsp:Transcript_100/g.288  ORF Transcript_100/g.288 Transcript_100/m.288 type:complete len:213 (-) Transcript_100:139-777(-)